MYPVSAGGRPPNVFHISAKGISCCSQQRFITHRLEPAFVPYMEQAELDHMVASLEAANSKGSWLAKLCSVLPLIGFIVAIYFFTQGRSGSGAGGASGVLVGFIVFVACAVVAVVAKAALNHARIKRVEAAMQAEHDYFASEERHDQREERGLINQPISLSMETTQTHLGARHLNTYFDVMVTVGDLGSLMLANVLALANAVPMQALQQQQRPVQMHMPPPQQQGYYAPPPPYAPGAAPSAAWGNVPPGGPVRAVNQSAVAPWPGLAQQPPQQFAHVPAVAAYPMAQAAVNAGFCTACSMPRPVDWQARPFCTGCSADLRQQR